MWLLVILMMALLLNMYIEIETLSQNGFQAVWLHLCWGVVLVEPRMSQTLLCFRSLMSIFLQHVSEQRFCLSGDMLEGFMSEVWFI